MPKLSTDMCRKYDTATVIVNDCFYNCHGSLVNYQYSVSEGRNSRQDWCWQVINDAGHVPHH